MSANHTPISLLVVNLCNLNNFAIEQVGEFLACQPLTVRAQFIARCASLIDSAAQVDAARYSPEDLLAIAKATGSAV